MKCCPASGCGKAIGLGYEACPEHEDRRERSSIPTNEKLDKMIGTGPKRAVVSDTHDYDPRYDRAQSVDGAKARYVADDCPDYGEADLERDLERLMSAEVA